MADGKFLKSGENGVMPKTFNGTNARLINMKFGDLKVIK
jgi:hypothetical protein